jgi:hypothetical protein
MRFVGSSNLTLSLEKRLNVRQHLAQYAAHAHRSVKRGDYIIRNLHLEIEVKCVSQYTDRSIVYISYSHAKRHQEMEKITGDQVIFAVFEKNGRRAVVDSLRMIPLKEVLSRRNAIIQYDERKKCLCVPFDIMYPKFEYLKRLRT